MALLSGSPLSGMPSRFRLIPVKERKHSHEADAIGRALAARPSWIGVFVVLLDGLDFTSVPSMTPGATFFELATQRDSSARAVLQALDDVYAAVRDGYDAAHIRGEMLERYTVHALSRVFPLRLAACAIEREGESFSDYRLDAATSTECPAVAIEAKTSEKALLGRRSADRQKHVDKAQWVLSLFRDTDGSILGVYVTWSPEARFRRVLARLVGEDGAKTAYILGHEQVAQLPGRVQALVGRLGVTSAS